MIGSLVLSPPSLADRAQAARERLQPSDSAKKLDDLLALKDEQIDLATAALLIERERDADLDVEGLRQQVDDLANEVVQIAPAGADEARLSAPQRRDLPAERLRVDETADAKRDRGFARLLLARSGYRLEVSTRQWVSGLAFTLG